MGKPTPAPKSATLRITLDAATWSKGYDDGLNGLNGDTHCLSYSSGFIEGRAQRKRLAGRES